VDYQSSYNSQDACNEFKLAIAGERSLEQPSLTNLLFNIIFKSVGKGCLLMTFISDILRKKLESVEDETSIQEVAKKMKDRDVSSLVVVDTDNKAVGIVTERDIITKVCINNVPTSKVISKEIMSRPLITINGSSSTSAAAEMMIKKDVRHLLVIDDRSKPIGIITPLDLTRNQVYTADEDREVIETVLDRYMEWL
jgi:signal-transduction protein with cAMP-binding, CBS, and nucleotidyltransferase domain